MTKDKKKKAAALKYSPSMNAPRVVAAGEGWLAAKIITAAREAGVPVREDPALAEALVQVPVGEEIPPELYQAVAEVLAVIMRAEEKASSRKG
ncbi:MAG: flagellar biosynthesis protein [Eubacteriales bacterium]|nr:flagellar biosynthesis protein [Eubacteriales bacterium]MDN5363130.1 flagellar biosynthesis protein [Eubacteriales bacterium]